MINRDGSPSKTVLASYQAPQQCLASSVQYKLGAYNPRQETPKKKQEEAIDINEYLK